MTADLFWIPGPWKGRLAVVTRPRGADWLEDEAEAWRHSGVDVIVSLLEKDEAFQLELGLEGDIAESKGVRYISFPIPDRGVPASTKGALAFLGNIGAILEQGKTVAIHCRQSVGRSGLVAAGLLVMSGMGADEAIDIVTTARGEIVPETQTQIRWIQNLAPGHLEKDHVTRSAVHEGHPT
jgi:protein-tyrosine phosphatase